VLLEEEFYGADDYDGKCMRCVNMQDVHQYGCVYGYGRDSLYPWLYCQS
jgi:hypothetical protein